jgi:hypothetical protein
VSALRPILFVRIILSLVRLCMPSLVVVVVVVVVVVLVLRDFFSFCLFVMFKYFESNRARERVGNAKGQE